MHILCDLIIKHKFDDNSSENSFEYWGWFN